MTKYYGQGYGKGSIKYGRKICCVTGCFDKTDVLLGASFGRSDSIIHGVYDYGLTLGGFGFTLSIGWFIVDCGRWE